jgi:hypothetical protein
VHILTGLYLLVRSITENNLLLHKKFKLYSVSHHAVCLAIIATQPAPNRKEMSVADFADEASYRIILL